MTWTHIYACSNCKLLYAASIGPVHLQYKENECLIEEMRAGKHGEEVARLLENYLYAIIDSSPRLYVCPSCLHWEDRMNETLYVPKDFRLFFDWVIEKKYLPGEIYGELADNWRVIKEDRRECPKCGTQMGRAPSDWYDEKGNPVLPCPFCGTVNKQSGWQHSF